MILVQSSTAVWESSTQETVTANHDYAQTIWCIFIRQRCDSNSGPQPQPRTDALDRLAMDVLSVTTFRC